MKKTFRITDDAQKVLNEIKEKQGFSSENQTIEFILNHYPALESNSENLTIELSKLRKQSSRQQSVAQNFLQTR